MPLYEIEAVREVLFLFQNVEADSEEEATKFVEMEMLDKLNINDISEAEVDWYPLEVTGIVEE